MFMEKKKKKVIGRLERVSLPEFGLKEIEAKIDTGAYNGAIHISKIDKIDEEGKEILKFTLLDSEHPEYNGKNFETTDFEKKQVKNSSGQSETRYFITTPIILKNEEFEVKLGLSDRSEMRFPVLIGRKKIKKRFVVDASKKFTN
jgi:hypothetical protein